MGMGVGKPRACGMAQQQQQQQPWTLHACTLALHGPSPAASSYWLLRTPRLVRLDWLAACVSLLRAVGILLSGPPTHVGLALALALAALAAGQLVAVRRGERTYAGARAWIVLAQRLLWGRYFSMQLPARGLLAAASWLVNMALQPLLQPLPFVVLAPLQLAEGAALLASMRPLLATLEQQVPAVMAPAAALHSVLEGVWHASFGFVFLTPAHLATCTTQPTTALAVVCVLYAGVLLPLLLAYKAELLDKARFAATAAAAAPAATATSTTAVVGSSSSQQQQRWQRSDEGRRPADAARLGGTASSRSSSASGTGTVVQLTGWPQLISQRLLATLVDSPGEDARDNVACALLLLAAAWGLARLVPPA